MANRVRTSALQRSGYRFLTKRQEQAFINRDISGVPNSFTPATSALSVGCFLVGLTMAIGLIISILHPRPDRGVNSILTTQSGGMYVVYGGELRPVTNLASARLIVGSPDNSQVTKNSTLMNFPRGPLMGIPSAPNSLDAHDDDPARWTVCDRRDAKSDLALTRVGRSSTVIVAGNDQLNDDAEVMDSRKAILARSATAPDVLWLVYNGHRAEIGPQDFATHAALGLTPAKMANAILLSGGLVDAIDVYPALTIPFLDSRSRVSSRVPDHAIGDVVVIGDGKGDRESYVIADHGVQRITSVIAALLINTGSRQIVEPSPEKITTLPQVQVIDTARYPEFIPDIVTPPAVCFQWEKARGESTARTRIITSDALPVKDPENMVSLNPPNKGVVQAQGSLMKPGLGWYVQVVGSSAASMSQEQLLYIDDTGTRYFISPDDKGNYVPVVGALGLNWQLPMPIPWAICQLYAQGSTLSIEAARMQHTFIPPNMGGVPAPAKPGEMPDPESGLPRG